MGYDIEKEKREAIEAGRRALNSLSAAKENLNSAKTVSYTHLIRIYWLCHYAGRLLCSTGEFGNNG